MAVDITKRVRNAFENTSPRNPLNKLHESDKCLLWALLTVYSYGETKPKKRSGVENQLEQATQTATDAAALAERIQVEVFQGELTEPLRPFLSGFQDLPLRLHAFASRLGSVVGSFGKAGHKERMLNNQNLIMASEFVRLRTGGYHDEHLAELFQAMSLDPKNRSDNPDDFSGDAIRAKRKHFKKTYPLLYRQAVKQVSKHRPKEERQTSSMDIFSQAFLSLRKPR